MLCLFFQRLTKSLHIFSGKLSKTNPKKLKTGKIMLEKDSKSNEKEEEMSFSDLLDESYKAPVKLKPGDKTAAIIFKITDEWVFLDLGGKSEGCLARSELADEKNDIAVSEGDSLEVFFLSENNGEMIFTTKVGKGSADKSHLEDAYRNRIPVEGSVEKEIKGGFSVKIAGSLRGFCPYSQMGLRRVDDAGKYAGLSLPFIITEYGERGQNIVLSNRAVLAAEQKVKKEALKETLKEGMTVTGTVTSVRDFGAFIDIDGAEGLVPISEIGWGRVENINEYISAGQQVEVEVMKLDWEKDRLSFSLKAKQPDPWEGVAMKYSEGSLHQGKVARLAKFGAFITLEPGIDGLIHISRLGGGKRINSSGDVLKAGQEIMVKIEKIELDKKRISLALYTDEVQEEKAESTDEYRNHVLEAKDNRKESFGTFGDIFKAKLDKKNK